MHVANVDRAPALTKSARKTYLVDRAFQLKYTLMLVGVGAFVSLLFGGMTLLVHLQAYQDLSLPPAVLAQLSHANVTCIWLLAAVTLGMACAFGLFGVLITHRVAGPVFVMKHYLSSLVEGRFPVRRPLRKHDELRGFFEQLQNALDLLREKELEETRILEEALTSLPSASPSPELARTRQVLTDLRDKKRKATGQFSG